MLKTIKGMWLKLISAKKVLKLKKAILKGEKASEQDIIVIQIQDQDGKHVIGLVENGKYEKNV